MDRLNPSSGRHRSRAIVVPLRRRRSLQRILCCPAPDWPLLCEMTAQPRMLLLCLLAASGGQRCVSGAYCPVGAGLARLLRGERVGSGAGAAMACCRGRSECVGAAGSSAMRFITKNSACWHAGRAKKIKTGFTQFPACKRASSLIRVNKRQTNRQQACRNVTLGLEGDTLLMLESKFTA